MEEDKKEFTRDRLRMLMINKVNLPCIEAQSLMATWWTSRRLGSISYQLFMTNHTGEKMTNWRTCGMQSKARTCHAGANTACRKLSRSDQVSSQSFRSPRITPQKHARSILQAPIVKANNGKQLRKLYDVCKRHIYGNPAVRSFQSGNLPDNCN